MEKHLTTKQESLFTQHTFDTKKTLYIGDIAKESINEWLEKNTQFNPKEMCLLQDCYNSYTYFMFESQKQVPLSKKMFAIHLRSILEVYEKLNKVQIRNRSNVQILGIKLINSFSN